MLQVIELLRVDDGVIAGYDEFLEVGDEKLRANVCQHRKCLEEMPSAVNGFDISLHNTK